MLLGVLIFGIVYTIAYIIICIFLIRGTKNVNKRSLILIRMIFKNFSQCDQRQVLPAVVFFALGTILSIIGLIHLSVSAVINVIISTYTFMVIYSLWRKFQEKDQQKELQLQESPSVATLDQVDI